MKNLIDGEWRDSTDQVANLNPFSGQEINLSPQANAHDIEDAANAALRAFGRTRARPSWQRAAILTKVAKGLSKRKSEFADLMTAEMGRPYDFNAGEVDRAIFTFTNAAEEAKRLTGEYLPLDMSAATEGRHAYWKREPIGPVLAITPFNFPLNLLAHKVAPALASGCTISVKVPPQAPNTGRLLAEVMMKAGCIPGEINVFDASSDVVEAAVRDERYKLLSFTGSPNVGWYLKSIAGKKKVILELGNASAAIVHHDVEDLAWAVERLRLGAFAAAGQVCISVQRIFVHEEIADHFIKKFAESCQGLSPQDPGTRGALIGPMIDEKAAQRVESWIAQAIAGGAEIISGQQRREGQLLWPVVLGNVAPDMKVNCEEVFGPVVTIERYSGTKALLERVNATPFGLQVGVMSDSHSFIQDIIEGSEVAGVIVNDFPTFRIDHMPYGGIKDSGLGREGVKYALDEYTEKKLVVINRNNKG